MCTRLIAISPVVHDEVEIMHKISHVNCVHLYEMFETSKKIYMVLELLTGTRAAPRSSLVRSLLTPRGRARGAGGELFDRIVAKGYYTEKDGEHRHTHAPAAALVVRH